MSDELRLRGKNALQYLKQLELRDDVGAALARTLPLLDGSKRQAGIVVDGEEHGQWNALKDCVAALIGGRGRPPAVIFAHLDLPFCQRFADYFTTITAPDDIGKCILETPRPEGELREFLGHLLAELAPVRDAVLHDCILGSLPDSAVPREFWFKLCEDNARLHERLDRLESQNAPATPFMP